MQNTFASYLWYFYLIFVPRIRLNDFLPPRNNVLDLVKRWAKNMQWVFIYFMLNTPFIWMWWVWKQYVVCAQRYSIIRQFAIVHNLVLCCGGWRINCFIIAIIFQCLCEESFACNCCLPLFNWRRDVFTTQQ